MAKQEPKVNAVNVSSVADIGLQVLHTKLKSSELYDGRGYEAPKNKDKTYESGSQGEH